MPKLLPPLRPAAFTARAAVMLLAAAPLVAHAQEATPPANSATVSAVVSAQEVYDVKAEALLQRAADRMKAARSFSGQVKTLSILLKKDGTVDREPVTLGTFRLQKPNRVSNKVEAPLRVEENKEENKKGREDQPAFHPYIQYVSDGKKGAKISVAGKTADKTYSALPVTKEALLTSYDLNFPEFFDPTRSDVQRIRDAKADGSLASLTLAPDAVWGGVPCFVVAFKSFSATKDEPSSLHSTIKIYIGKQDSIVRGYHEEYPKPDGGRNVIDTIATKAVYDDSLPSSVFALNLTGYKEEVVPKELPLLAAGTLAPDFTVQDKNDKPVKLSDFRGKVVILDFWATWCGPCMASLPHTAEVAKKTADKGVMVLALNVWDKKDAFAKWLPAHPEFSALTFAIDTTPGKGQDVATKLYNVSGIPTQYVIDRDGKIITSFVVGSADDLEKAIAKAAVGTQK